MRIEAIIADAVRVTKGKLDVEGAGWNHLFVNAVPTHHRRIGLGILVTGDAEEMREHHSVVVRLADPDGRPLVLGFTNDNHPAPCDQIEVGFKALPPFAGSPLPEHVFPIAINLDRLRFQRLGIHRFCIALDGVEVASIAYAVAQASVLAQQADMATQRVSEEAVGPEF